MDALIAEIQLVLYGLAAVGLGLAAAVNAFLWLATEN